MHYKIEGTIKRNKGRFIIFAVLWLIMAIVLVAPLACAVHIASADGVFDLGKCITEILSVYSNFGDTIRKVWRIYTRIL